MAVPLQGCRAPRSSAQIQRPGWKRAGGAGSPVPSRKTSPGPGNPAARSRIRRSRGMPMPLLAYPGLGRGALGVGGAALGVGEALGVGGTAGADVPCGAGAGGSGVQAAKAAAATARGTVRNVLRSMCTPWNCGEIRPESRGARSALRERNSGNPHPCLLNTHCFTKRLSCSTYLPRSGGRASDSAGSDQAPTLRRTPRSCSRPRAALQWLPPSARQPCRRRTGSRRLPWRQSASNRAGGGSPR